MAAAVGDEELGEPQPREQQQREQDSGQKPPTAPAASPTATAQPQPAARSECLLGKQDYGILQVIQCHKQDVRAVCAFPRGAVLTGSRDQTAKLYEPEQAGNTHSELAEVRQFDGPQHFVSAICCGKTKDGQLQVYVGSHDFNIYVYDPHSSSAPVETLMRHSGPVCTLAHRICDSNQEVLVSGAWDGTAVIWRDKLADVSLYGHVHAIWSVAFVARSFILTGGADKTIRKWSVADGQLLNVFDDGHSDCVRGLAVINGAHFLSCSNDATVILWTIDGIKVKIFEGHENFIYDICIIREPLGASGAPPAARKYLFVTVSEDKSVRVWDKDAGCLQKIALQATSLWSVAALDNTNFVVGTSDGHAYVFSHLSASMAAPQSAADEPRPSSAAAAAAEASS